jgi:RimJ/RimL family protein N-acetyltransferase
MHGEKEIVHMNIEKTKESFGKRTREFVVVGNKLALRPPKEREIHLFHSWFEEPGTREWLNLEEPLIEEKDFKVLRRKFRATQAPFPSSRRVTGALHTINIKPFRQIEPGETLPPRPFSFKVPINLPREHPSTVMRARERLRGELWREKAPEQPSIVFSVVRIADGALVGVVSLCHINLNHWRGDIRTIIATEFRGEGLAVETKLLAVCFGLDFLMLNRVSSHVLAQTSEGSYGGNQGSLWANTKCGFRKEGRLVEYHLGLDGKWYDIIIMTIHRKNWSWERAIEKLKRKE